MGLGSIATGLGNVQTAGEPPNGIGTAGPPGGITTITATTPAVIVDNPDPANRSLRVATAAPPDIGPNEGTAAVAPTQVEPFGGVPGQKLVAQWTIGAATRRFFAVDFVNGNDANAGFSSVSMAAAGLVAKKTLAGLRAIFPTIGAGRSAEIAIANGGVNTGQTFAEDLLGGVLNGCEGYAPNMPIVRTTGTNTTASATAFAGDAADLNYCGCITATGCNTAGYNPVAAGTTNQVVNCLKVGGAAPALPAEPGSPLGWRIRFSSTTATVALRNVSRMVAAVATAQVTTATTLPAVPAAADVFFLEMAPVTVLGGNLWGGYAGLPLGSLRPMQLIGFNFSTPINVSGAGIHFAMCQVTGTPTFGACIVGSDFRYIHPTGTISVGGGLRATAQIISNNGGIFNLQCCVGETFGQFSNPTFFNWKVGCVFGTGLAVLGVNSGDAVTVSSIGSESTQLRCRIIASSTNTGAGLSLNNCRVKLGAIDFTNMAARPGLTFSTTYATQLAGTALTGTTGNTDVGLALSTPQTSSTYDACGQTNTVTGTAGDVRVNTPTATQILTWAALAVTGIADGKNGRICINNGPVCVVGKFSGRITTDPVNATASHMADPGASIASINLEPQRYPSSLRLVTRLRATALMGPVPIPFAITLYINGVVTAMTVAIPINQAQYTKFADLAHSLLLADGDDFDLRITSPAGTGPGTATGVFSAVLEGPS